ncbi:MAG: isocitrate/isopropylmalate dehydrogenase family protein [Candidatus Caldarchaeales archaeon]|jgi:3-isopropylmalate dehydrogenase|nr:isocitrate/isopropylmalate dehydrogenase family protein [Candidatus Caldarchaeales archaeon]MDT7915245.1 isocitrate/isopropylmalate dehydrogenase family protein [Candidatus Caldarchaeales archaeon]
MYRISVIQGDGIGPVVVSHTVRILSRVLEGLGVAFELVEAPAGDKVAAESGEPLPNDSIQRIAASDACLKGPVGETAKDVIVYLRQRLDLYANIRPFKTYAGVRTYWSGVDLVIVRENTEDLYKGVEDIGLDHAVSLLVITRRGTERIARVALEMAMGRRRKVTIVHKGNVLASYRYFRDIATEVLSGSGVEVDEMYVDNAAYQLVVNPSAFDVVLTPNMFGDILSDLAAGVTGSIGIAGSANIGDRHGIFEPVHGSAPGLAPSLANPIATILSASYLLSWLGGKRRDDKLLSAGRAIESAVSELLDKGSVLTPDLGGSATGQMVADEILRIALAKLGLS